MNRGCSVDDGLSSVRAGAKQALLRERKWVALILLSLVKKRNSRKNAEEKLVKFLCSHRDEKSELGDFPRRILSVNTDWLSTTYQVGKFYRSRMEFAAAAEVDIPPLPDL